MPIGGGISTENRNNAGAKRVELVNAAGAALSVSNLEGDALSTSTLGVWVQAFLRAIQPSGQSARLRLNSDFKLQVESEAFPSDYLQTAVGAASTNTNIWVAGVGEIAHITSITFSAAGAGVITVKDANNELVMVLTLAAAASKLTGFQGEFQLTDAGDDLTCDWTGGAVLEVTVTGHND